MWNRYTVITIFFYYFRRFYATGLQSIVGHIWHMDGGIRVKPLSEHGRKPGFIPCSPECLQDSTWLLLGHLPHAFLPGPGVGVLLLLLGMVLQVIRRSVPGLLVCEKSQVKKCEWQPRKKLVLAVLSLLWIWIELCRAVDPHKYLADPDPDVHLNADPVTDAF